MVDRRTNRGSRGKQTERDVEDYLQELNETHSKFAYHRLPDARAARGALAAQPSDFLMSVGYKDKGGFYFVEAKETEHNYRLPYDKVSQYAVLRKWANAGAEAIVLIYHSNLAKWRLLFLDELQALKEEADNGKRGSWYLYDFELYPTAKAAMEARGVT